VKYLTEEFSERIENIKEKMYRIAFQYLNNQTSALDAVDEATYKAFKKLGQLKNKEFFDTWIIRILINICKKEIIRNKKEIVCEELPETAVEEFDKLPLKEAITKLPVELKSVIILRFFNSLTISETALVLKIPVGTVSTRQRKALSLLKLELEETV